MSQSKTTTAKKDVSTEKRIKTKNDTYQRGFVSSAAAISKKEAEPFVLENDSDFEEEKKEPQLTMINTCEDPNGDIEDIVMQSPKTKTKKRRTVKGNKKDDDV